MRQNGQCSWVLWFAGAALAASSCDGADWEATTEHEGTVARRAPAESLDVVGGTNFVATPHRAGEAPGVSLVDVRWGRLVDVYDLDAAGGQRTLRLRDVLIGESIASDGLDFELGANLATRGETLTIRHAFGTAEFDTALRRAESACETLGDRSFDPRELPPFDRVPRNAVLAVSFDDLLDAGTVDARSVTLVGGEQLDQVLPARVWADPSHGGLRNGVFHSTRVLVDPRAGGERVGLPAAESLARANAGLRIATHSSSGEGLVRNAGGAAISARTSGSVDPNSPTRDIVRAFRSGGASGDTGDTFSGFMADTTPPRLLLNVDCTLTKVVHPAGAPADEFDVLVRFPTEACAVRRRPGDAIETATHVAQVLSVTTTFVRVRVIQGAPATFTRSTARYTTPWTPGIGQRAECALRFSPPAGALPVAQVSPDASIRVRFDEAIDPASVRPFDSFRVRRSTALSPLDEFVVGSITPDASSTSFTFQPLLALSHSQGVAELYSVDLDGAQIRDLAGNALADDPPLADFTLAPTQPTQLNAGIVLRFASTDEDGDGRSDVRGQVLYDLVQGVLRPRPVTRFSAPVDATSPTVGAMQPLPSLAVQTPLSPYGSKSMNVWRYSDLGFGLRDEATHNLDVEGLWWRPFNGQLAADSFTQFQISLAHSRYLPDEALDTGLLPSYTNSGVVGTFASNVSSPTEDPLTVVHAKTLGYPINPADAALTPSGDVIAPYPLNRGVSPAQFNYWTWRDTSKIAVGAPFGAGADTARLAQIVGPAASKGFYPPNEVPTIGLPLLTEFRTYPDAGANGLNSFSIAIAINSSARPFFRAYSTGGVNPITGAIKIVDPDNAIVADGGINPNGGPTTPLDNVFYFGQADFVVRLSRMHTRWLDTQAAATQFAQPVVDLAGGAPLGTGVIAAFRGASQIAGSSPTNGLDSEHYDAYGDGYTASQLVRLGLPATLAFTPTFFPAAGDKSWRANVAALDGARFVQARLSFVCDPLTGAAPVLDSFALAYSR
jgi:hypothetical protein